jgi:hypothetical protein
VVPVRTDISEELIAYIIRVTRISELGTTLVVTSNKSTLLVTVNVLPSLPILVTLMAEAIYSSETPVIKRSTLRHTPKDGSLLDSNMVGAKVSHISFVT